MMSDADRTKTTAMSRHTPSYLLGAGLGMIPAGMELVATLLQNKTSTAGTAFLLGTIGLILYGLAVPFTLFCLVSPRSRWFGFGLLTVIATSGVVVFGFLSAANP